MHFKCQLHALATSPPGYLYDKIWMGLGASLHKIARENIPVPAMSLEPIASHFSELPSSCHEKNKCL
jgi:hypothetical protein